MTTAFLLWLGLAGVVGLIWLVRIVAIGPILRSRRVLSTTTVFPAASSELPRLSVLVAAKDEEENIETCVTSLLTQNYPNFEVIAIDDRSTDATGDLLRHLSRSSNGRLRHISVSDLPDGWFGKNHAMHLGTAHATGDWLCFTDADCRQISPESLRCAMREAQTGGADFLCVTPVLDADRVWERITQPVCAAILMIWFLPQRVNNPRCSTAYANGAFMLLRRSCYEAIGGHAAVRDRINEDMQLARAAKRAGFRLRVVENDDLYRTRMYRTIRDSWRGWSRIFYGCLGTMPRLAAAAAMVAAVSLLPWASFVAAIGGTLLADDASRPRWQWAACSWGGVVLLMQFVLLRFYQLMRMHPIWSATYVIGAATALGMLINAMFKAAGASTTWRGTTYAVHAAARPKSGIATETAKPG